jgi:hypothetical protein
MTDKAAAYRFLKTLHERLNEGAPQPDLIKSQVDAIWKKPKHEKTEREKLESKENIPLYYFALPQIFELGKSTTNLTEDQMKQAFRCVYFGKYPELSGSNPFRKSGHPFSKKWGLSPDEIMEAWRKPLTNMPANQAWPEAALSTPFPFKILFEAKYFEGDSAVSAENELVCAIYETVFYRGLPASGKWGYDFGCLLAYDVSTGAHLKAAWESITSKRLFWEDANVFVMIVRSNKEPT